MTTHAPRRLLFSALALASAILACARAEVPIDATGQSIATALVIPATSTATAPAVAIATATNPLAEATVPGSAPTSAPSPSQPPSPTPEQVFDSLPLLNGTFDTDLSNWSVTPNWVVWQDGYARVNAGQAEQGAVLVQFATVPRGLEVKLHFSVRSETALDGECVIEAHRDTLHRIPADGAWHEQEVDYTLEAGTQTAISLQARNNNHCDWLHFDDLYWLVAAGSIASGPTPEGSTPDAPTPETTEAAPTALPTLGAIPAEASFTQDFTVSASGDSPFGAAADLTDGQALTWASLRSGSGAWVFDLGASRSVAGLRLLPQRDGDQDATLLGVDVSADGTNWTAVYTASGDCAGTAGCQSLAPGLTVDLPFAPTDAQYVRVRSGPTRFALAEVQIAVIGN